MKFDSNWALIFSGVVPAVVPAVVITVPAYATDYLTIEQAQKILFPAADQFVKKPVSLTEDQRDKIKDESGTRQRLETQPAWQVLLKGSLLGWYFVDEVIGKHEYITYAVGVTKDGKVMGVEILSYRETHGGEIRRDEWRKEFVGKTLADKFKLDKDVPNISGATLSCRNVLDGVKRLLILHKQVLVAATGDGK